MTWLQWIKDIWNTMVEETYKREMLMYHHDSFYIRNHR